MLLDKSDLKHRAKTALAGGYERLGPLFRPICILTAIYLLGICAILRANFSYYDDLGRVFEGFQDWGHECRYLSDFFSTLLHADTHLTDVSPLPQITAVVLLAVASVIVLYAFTGRKRFTFWEYAAVLPLGLSPYFLSCLSYKFDAPYMALSVLIAAAPLLMRSSAPRWAAFAAAALCALGVMTSYQASSGIFPMAVALLAFKAWREGTPPKAVLVPVAVSAAGYLTGMVIFAVFIMPLQSSYYGVSLPPLAQLLPNMYENIKRYYALFLSDFDRKWLVLSGLVILLFLFVSVRDTRRNRLVALLLAAAAVGACVLLCFGAYLVLPLFYPRTMYGVGAGLAFFAVSVASAGRMLPGRLICLALSWCFFVFAFTYGNALDMQKTYTEFRIEEVIDSIKGLDAFSSDTPVIVQLTGSAGYAPPVRNMMQDDTILQHLIPRTFATSEGYWESYTFMHYYDLPNIIRTKTVDLNSFDLPVIDETVYHTIRGNDHFLLIDLKE